MAEGWSPGPQEILLLHPLSVLAGVRPLRLRLCQWQRDERQGGHGGELHIPAPERPPARHRVGAPAAPADRRL